MGHYRFHHIWRLAHDPRRVYEVLADGERYPEWWPQVRRARRIDEHSGVVVCRSVLPYELRMLATRTIDNPDEMHLRATLAGDLIGWAEWRLESSGRGCIARFEQEVDTTGLIKHTTPIARPIFEWNHMVMMRGGERGLSQRLARQASATHVAPEPGRDGSR